MCKKQLPERCSKEWYFATFCGVGKEEFVEKQYEELGEDTNILHHLRGHVKPYDVVCFMLNIVDCVPIFDWASARVRHAT